MRGGARAARRFVGWQTFFDFGDGEVKPNKKIDTKISTALFTLPLGAIATHDAPTALPQRNLLRHLTWQLPSGQSVARTMGVTPLAAADLQELAALGVGFERSTPLWYYVLKEAEVVADGLHLGPVGGRIVAEVLLGLLQTDPGSYLATQPALAPDAAEQERAVPHDGLPDLRGRRPGVTRAVRRRSAQTIEPPPGHGRGDGSDEESEDGCVDHGASVRRAAPAVLPARRPTGHITDVRNRPGAPWEGSWSPSIRVEENDMAEMDQTVEALNDAAIALAEKAKDAGVGPTALQYAYAAAALANAARGVSAGSSYATG